MSTGRPPFRADHVGSLLRPQALRQAFRQHAAGQLGDADFARLQDDCIRDVVRLQQEAGLQVVTDGEFRRGSYWGRFVERIDGVAIKPAVFKLRDDQGHEVEFTAPNGDRFAGVLKEIDERGAVFDFNHPLAGQRIRFQVRILGIL